jgi:predicted RNase H-like HicB family nuclease
MGYCQHMKLRAIIHNAEEGGFWAEVPALPGCLTQGETKEELEANLHEAVEGWLAAGEAEMDIDSGVILELAV